MATETTVYYKDIKITTHDLEFSCFRSKTGNNQNVLVTVEEASSNSREASSNTSIVIKFIDDFLIGYFSPNNRNKHFISRINYLRECIYDQNLEDEFCKYGNRSQCVITDGSRSCPESFFRRDTPYRQFFYGQVKNPHHHSQLISYASFLTTVAHEIFHSVTYLTNPTISGERISGSLAESYSDIFAIIIANRDCHHLQSWDWGIYYPLGQLRDLEHPERFGQAIDMRREVTTTHAYDTNRDKYYNHGVHNLAAFKIITTNIAGKYLFYNDQDQVDLETITTLFYEALKGLTSNPSFSDSYASFINAASESPLGDDPRSPQMIRAIHTAFRSVGVQLADSTKHY